MTEITIYRKTVGRWGTLMAGLIFASSAISDVRKVVFEESILIFDTRNLIESVNIFATG